MSTDEVDVACDGGPLDGRIYRVRMANLVAGYFKYSNQEKETPGEAVHVYRMTPFGVVEIKSKLRVPLFRTGPEHGPPIKRKGAVS